MTAEELSSIIGADAAMALISRTTGQQFYIPKKVTENIVTMCGSRTAAEKFVSIYGGRVLNFPKSRRWQMRYMDAKGMSRRDIALALSVSERAVYAALSSKTKPA